jgi:hypothetical protein
MPLTPFIGLSILVHIVLIIVYKTFNIVPSKKRTIRHYSAFNTWLGLVIITGVFSFVFVSAAFLVHASIVEEHSSINLIRHNSAFLQNLLHVNINEANAYLSNFGR